MRETQENIRKYKKQLGTVKYKIVSMAVMLIVSIAMLTTTSFAWLILSTAPEVSEINTTIAGNGNLEIALASSNESGDLVEPELSQVGDGSKDLVSKNKTWGNLINLSDSSYGLHKITLKPALLNTVSFRSSPLLAVTYD